jgi:hypothetical protein
VYHCCNVAFNFRIGSSLELGLLSMSHHMSKCRLLCFRKTIAIAIASRNVGFWLYDLKRVQISEIQMVHLYN